MFQANYKDIRMASTETVLLSLFFEDFGQVFVSWVIFKKVILFKRSENFRGHKFVFYVSSKNLKYYENRLNQKILLSRSSRSQIITQKVFLRIS